MSNKQWIIPFSSFVIINVLLYLFISSFHSLIPFNSVNYFNNAHHYLTDQRSTGGQFTLLRSLGQYDAQWYLKIAKTGYPEHPRIFSLANKETMGAQSYAFFPLYPLLLHVINNAVGNIELTAFVVTNILLLVSYSSLFFVLGKLYGEKIAVKAIFLMFLSPFSIFYRSYFTEGLFLVGLIWFVYFLIKKQWLFTALCLGCLLVIRPTGLFLLPVFFYILSKQLLRRQLAMTNYLAVLLLALMPFFAWMIYCSIHTGDALYFYHIRSTWFTSPSPFFYNVGLIIHFFGLPAHGFHYSQLDIFTLILTALGIIFSKKYLRLELWLVSLALFLGPLLTTDTMSFTRYQAVSFPLFIYLALVLKPRYYLLITLFCAVCLMVASLLFVNWYWIG